MDDLHKVLSIKSIVAQKFENGQNYFGICWNDSWISESLLKLSFPEYLMNAKQIFDGEIKRAVISKDVTRTPSEEKEDFVYTKDRMYNHNGSTTVTREDDNNLPTSPQVNTTSSPVPSTNTCNLLPTDRDNRLINTTSSPVPSKNTCNLPPTDRDRRLLVVEKNGLNEEESFEISLPVTGIQQYNKECTNETMLFICSLCSESFTTHQQLITHSNDCCERCDSSTNEFHLNHMKPEQDTSEIECRSNCESSKSFGRTYRRKSTIEPSKTIVYECLNCKMTFANTEYLSRHLVRCKSCDDLNFKCPTCNKGFTTKGSLTLHEKAIHLKKKEFGCSICGKLFSKKHILKIHLDTHFDKRNFQCSACGKTFIQKSNLTRHERIHEEKNYGYICKYCGQVYSQNQYLKIHLASHTKSSEDTLSL